MIIVSESEKRESEKTKNFENQEDHGCDMKVLGQFKVENDVNLVEASGVKMSSRSADSSISWADRGVLSIILRELSSVSV